jgi:predicted transcriptional regulator
MPGENEDKRPAAVQKEKMQIMLNLTETAFKRIEEGFDEQVAELMDPYWEKIYLKKIKIGYDPRLPFTSSDTPMLELRFQ